jgi:hypothetical protein
MFSEQEFSIGHCQISWGLLDPLNKWEETVDGALNDKFDFVYLR